MEATVHSISGSNIDRVVIRKLTRADLAALEWSGEFTHFRNVYQNVYKRMKKGTAMAWVAEVQTEGVVGQLFLQLNCDRPELADGWNRAYLYSFRIKPDHRNRGTGSKMVAIVEDYLLARHFSFLTLNVARDNTDAIRLYQRLGFQIVAKEPGIWSYEDHQGNWQTVEEPSWRMEKRLMPATR